MKAEIGFIFEHGKLTERLRLTVKGESASEDTLLHMFAARYGCKFDMTSGKVTLDQTEAPEGKSK